jgi:hypothetical protein
MQRGEWGVGRVLLVLVFVLFTVGGLAMAVSGDGDTRRGGIVVLLFFGLGGVAFIVAKSKGSGAGLAVETVRWEGMPQRALVMPVRPGKWLTTMLALAGMGTASLLMGIWSDVFTDPGEHPLFIWLVGFGGGGFLLLMAMAHLLALRNGAPRLALLPTGLAMTGGPSQSFIPWEAVTDVGTFEMAIRRAALRMVAVKVVDPTAIRRPLLTRVLMVGQRYFYGSDVNLPEVDFALDAEQIASLVRAYWQNPSLRQVADHLPEGPLAYEQAATQILSPDVTRGG